MNTAGSSDAEAPIFDLGLSMATGIVSSGIYNGWRDFGFGVVNFPFLGGGVPSSPSCGVCVSRLVCFATVCSGVDGFGSGGLFLADGLLKPGCGYRKVRKSFSKFYRWRSELVVKYNVGLETSTPRHVGACILWQLGV